MVQDLGELKEIQATIEEFAKKLDRLKITYEQYFMGIEKREPLVQLKDVVRVMRSLENIQIRNTGMRFRYRTLVQKFNTFKTYWNRTLREIERGTYHRDVSRVRRKMAQKGISMPSAGKLRTVADVERALTEARKEEEALASGVSNDTDKVPAITDDRLAQIRGVPAEQIRRDWIEPEAAVTGPLDLEADLDADEEEQTNRRQSDMISMPPPPAPPGQRSPSRPDLPASPSQVMQRSPSRPDLPASPSQVMQRSPSKPDLPASPSQVLQRPPSRPDMPASPGAQRPRRQSRPRPQQQPQQAKQGGLSEEKMQSIYRRFVKAKKLCGEDTSSVRYESLVSSINRQLPKLRAQSQGRDVDFQVVIRNGRAILKAKVK